MNRPAIKRTDSLETAFADNAQCVIATTAVDRFTVRFRLLIFNIARVLFGRERNSRFQRVFPDNAVRVTVRPRGTAERPGEVRKTPRLIAERTVFFLQRFRLFSCDGLIRSDQTAIVRGGGHPADADSVRNSDASPRCSTACKWPGNRLFTDATGGLTITAGNTSKPTDVLVTTRPISRYFRS